MPLTFVLTKMRMTEFLMVSFNRTCNPQTVLLNAPCFLFYFNFLKDPSGYFIVCQCHYLSQLGMWLREKMTGVTSEINAFHRSQAVLVREYLCLHLRVKEGSAKDVAFEFSWAPKIEFS